MREVRSIMGMPVVLEIIDPAAPEVYEAVFTYLHEVDERFSTYKDTSEISVLNRGDLAENQCSTAMREVLALSLETGELSQGYFSIRTLDGSLDPSGLVKGWAMQKVVEQLHEQGFNNFYFEIAGDIQVSGLNAEGKEWSIGIRNPFHSDEIVKVIYPHGMGVATSGTYIRGAHIYNPFKMEVPAQDFISLTVLGPNVYEADRFATAAFAMGESGLQFIEQLDGFEAYGIDHSGIARMTSGFENYTRP